MTITFCGHSHFIKTNELEAKILTILSDIIGNKTAEIYLGGYGGFDNFAYDCCKLYKNTHPNVSLVFVTPYITEDYERNHLCYIKTKYDAILYPEIEKKPLKFAIAYRNRYMVEKSDYIISYISHDWGGAYTTYKYAKKLNKPIFNLTDFN